MFVLKKRLRPALAVAAAAAAAVLVAGCSSGGTSGAGDDEAAVNQDLTVGWTAPPDTLNPATTGSRSVGPLVATMFEMLVSLDQENQPMPGLATAWEISTDGLKYDFTLRQDVKFHDGTTFNAQAVVDNFNYITNEETQSTISIGLIGPCTTATALSEFVVSISCDSPYAPLLTQLGEPYMGMQSPEAIKKYGKDLGQYPTGTGPFEFVSYEPNQSFIVKKNPDYDWAPATATAEGPAKLDKITFNFIPNDQSRVGALQSGQAQLIQSTPGIYYNEFKDRYSQATNPISGLGVFAPINADAWPTDQLEVRQAIMYAIDRPTLTEFASAGVLPANDVPLTKGIFGHDPLLSGMYPHDPVKAKEVLETGGWTEQDGGWVKDGKKLALKITTLSTSPTYPRIAQAMQGALQKVGIDASVEQMGSAAWVDTNVEGNFNITPLTYVAVDPDALSLWFMPGSFYNWSHYTNDKLTALLTEGKATMDSEARTQIYKDAQKLIMEQAVLMPIYENQDLLSFSKKLTGITYTGGGFENFYDASFTS